MPVKRQQINDYGIRIDHRTYDHKVPADGGRPVGDPLQPARSRPDPGTAAEA